MRLTVKQLREEVRKAGGQKVAASASYMKKEAVKGKLQDVIMEMVRQGEISDKASLEDALKTLAMALESLKHVPFEAWTQMTGGAMKKAPGKR